MKDYRVYQYYVSGFKVLRGTFSKKDAANRFLSDMKEQYPQSFYDVVCITNKK